MPSLEMNPGRRSVLRAVPLLLAAPLLTQRTHADPVPGISVQEIDRERMRSLAAFTMQSMTTPYPIPYGAEIFDTRSGVSLMRALNAVGPQHDPSAHGEIVTIRLACQKLQSPSLRGYTLYTTCEPCPMCMACCLWSGMDRVVYGATIDDAAKYGHQIMIPSAEVARRCDIPCIVDGPVERAACLELFTNPAMQKVFQQWKARG